MKGADAIIVIKSLADTIDRGLCGVPKCLGKPEMLYVFAGFPDVHGWSTRHCTKHVDEFLPDVIEHLRQAVAGKPLTYGIDEQPF